MKEQDKDHGAALLRVDPSAGVQTAALPSTCEHGNHPMGCILCQFAAQPTWPTAEQLEWWANAARTAWGERDLAWQAVKERDALLIEIRSRWHSSHELVAKINALIGSAPESRDAERAPSTGRSAAQE